MRDEQIDDHDRGEARPELERRSGAREVVGQAAGGPAEARSRRTASVIVGWARAISQRGRSRRSPDAARRGVGRGMAEVHGQMGAPPEVILWSSSSAFCWIGSRQRRVAEAFSFLLAVSQGPVGERDEGLALVRVRLVLVDEEVGVRRRSGRWCRPRR